MNQILVVIPAYNCSKELVKVLSKIVAKPMLAHVTYWVVDNLSHDDTYETARKFVLENKMKNIQIYLALENNSLGGTHKIAFNEGIKSEYDYVAIFHGDNQGDYSDLYNILIKLENENPHCSYLGNRFSRQSSLRLLQKENFWQPNFERYLFTKIAAVTYGSRIRAKCILGRNPKRCSLYEFRRFTYIQL